MFSIAAVNLVSARAQSFATRFCGLQRQSPDALDWQSAANDRVALFLMDYPERNRLKILGHAQIEDAREHPELVSQLAEKEAQPIVERFFIIDVVPSTGTAPNTSRRVTLPKK